MQLVLIVERDVLLRAAMSRSLNKLPSVEVIEAGTVAEARQLLHGMSIDLVVCNVELSDGTALELLPRLEEDDIAAVLVSEHVAEVAARLPSGLELHAVPMSALDLCQLVARKLGCADVRLPFSLADYVQLAAMGQHSVTIEVLSGGELAGSVEIVRGEAWRATDALGEGIDAFLRLLGDPEAVTSCTPARATEAARNLSGSCQHLLMEGMRILDERRANKVRTLPPIPPPASLPVPPRQAPRGSGAIRQVKPANPEREFDRLYALGIDALLGKRYREACDALYEASQLRTTASLTANLARLRELGFAPQGAAAPPAAAPTIAAAPRSIVRERSERIERPFGPRES